MEKARIVVRLRPGILDPQGTTIRRALEGLGFPEVRDMRVGKVLDLTLDETDAALKKIDWLMRDWRQNQEIRMDPHLIDLVWEAHREVGSKNPIHVVCGYRAPVTNAMRSRNLIPTPPLHRRPGQSWQAAGACAASSPRRSRRASRPRPPAGSRPGSRR